MNRLGEINGENLAYRHPNQQIYISEFFFIEEATLAQRKILTNMM